MKSNGWKTKRLKDVAPLQRGFDLTKANLRDGAVPVISSSGLWGYHDEAKVTGPGIVIGRYGTLGDVFFVEEDFWPHNTTLWVTDFCGNDPQFVNYLYHSLDISKHSGKTGVPGLNRNDLHTLKIEVPPLPEQQKIAAILSTWDRAIELAEKLIAAKQKRKQALMQQLLTGKVRFAEFVNDPWPVKNLSDIGEFHKGKGISKSDVIESGLPAILYGELYTTHNVVVHNIVSFISDATAGASFPLQTGDILFPTSGETADEIGKPAVYQGKSEAFAGGDIIVFRSCDVDPIFLAYALNAHDAFRYRRSVGQGQSVVHIYKANLVSHPVPIPSVAEQRRIAQVLDEAQQEIESLHRRSVFLESQKKGLMQQLLTGKVRVNVDAETVKG